jgi:hypothetical protein
MTLSPFRYVQLARYVLQKWAADTAPIVKAVPSRRKARAVDSGPEPVLYEPPPSPVPPSFVSSTASSSSNTSTTSSPTDSSSINSPTPTRDSTLLQAKVDEDDKAGKRATGNSNMDSSGMGMGIPSSVGQIPVAGPSSSSPRRDLRPDPRLPPEPNDIYRLMNDERLFVKGHAAGYAPREIVVLCHGESLECTNPA